MTETGFPKIILHKGKDRSVSNFHPWIFSGAVKSQPKDIAEGDIAEVFSHDGHYLGTGHFHKGTILLRIISFEPTDCSVIFWENKLKRAYSYRETLSLIDNANTNAYRLINAEGDGLPGLIIDIYNDVAVIQSHTLGMSTAISDITTALQKIYGKRLNAIYNKSFESLQKQNQEVSPNDFLFKSAAYKTDFIIENGYRFSIDFVEGQKTGFFLDQRENRKLISQYSKDKKVLNTFCYSGGFSVYAIGAGAKLVHSVDSSKKAIEQANENVAANFPDADHESFAMDVFSFLKQSKEKYDVIVLDPPAFAKHLSAVKNAMVGYRNLNYEGIKNISPGGILFTFSCSQAIDKDLFRKVVFQAASQAKRTVKIMHQLSQPADHPISIYHPEGEYLKGLVLYVE
jgi:23S rRNA (cytosine1962-C5)-methyltransferase